MKTRMMKKIVETLLKKCRNKNETSELIKLSYSELYMLFLNTGFTEEEFEELHKNNHLKSTEATLDYLNSQVELVEDLRIDIRTGEEEYISTPIFNSVLMDADGYSFEINKNFLTHFSEGNMKQI